ncbi:putative glutamate--cysteine ligase 2 [Cellulomonas chitinilytica]|uniref:Putative glutamate--cysteine ligase 2 n=1 Tax=Cellulomonas chitinilytica TaxID=398759 RepID=A0A919P0L6_9CELL|nr:glutamate--cysteine ligase [Cellulomonas chitinilytica]GIG20470.1 putative glutamate--cysteine ligase 2 [Cellulomonas chitinilytica]
MRTLGVEEEFLLVTPDGVPQAVSGAVLRFASLDPPAVPGPGTDEPGGSIEKEFKQEQVEISTRPRHSLRDLLAEVRAGRELADAYARRAGARIAALGTAPQPVESTVLADRRALEIRARFGQTAREQLTCGCHVHVEVADDDEGVVVLDHLRTWTPVLLALSANSPSWQGRTTGYASYRSQVWGRWPTAGPTAPFGDGAGYHGVVADLLRSGTILDDGMIYFDARLSAHYPTVEVRVADVCLDPADAVLQAGLVRALAETAVRQGRRHDGHPRTELLRAATWRAARSGLSGELVSPAAGLPRPAVDVIGELVDHVRDALVDAGDLELVERQLGHVLRRGNGAVEQLAWRAEGAQDDEVVRRAVDRTVPATTQD